MDGSDESSSPRCASVGREDMVEALQIPSGSPQPSRSAGSLYQPWDQRERWTLRNWSRFSRGNPALRQGSTSPEPEYDHIAWSRSGRRGACGKHLSRRYPGTEDEES